MINTLVTISLKFSILFLAYAFIKKLVGDKLNANVGYRLWFVLFVVVCLPLSFESKFSLETIVDLKEIIEINTDVPNPTMTYNLITLDQKQQSNNHHNFIMVIYILGVLSSLTFAGVFHIILIKSSNKVSCSSIDEVTHLMAYPKKISVYETTQLQSPAVMGVLKKRLLMPIQLTDQLSKAECKYIFMHEIMHLKQYDHMINYLLLFFKSIFWFNPLTHVFYYMIKDDMEFACDQKLMNYLSPDEKKSYGHMLLNIASPIHKRTLHVVSPLIQNKKVLGMRIKKMMNNKKYSKVLLLALVMVLAAISFVVMAKPIAAIVEASNESVVIEDAILDRQLANNLVDDYAYALEILKNHFPYLVTEYRDFNNNTELIEKKYRLIDDSNKTLRVVTKLGMIHSIDIVGYDSEDVLTLVDSTYVIQTPIINENDQLLIIKDEMIGQAVTKEIVNANAIKFVYRTEETEQLVYLLKHDQEVLSIFTENKLILKYRYFSLDNYDVNLQTLFWETFYNRIEFDYDEFKTVVLPQVKAYVAGNIDFTKNIFPVDMGDFYLVFLDQNYSVRISKSTGEIFYISIPENIHYDAKIGLDETESKAIAKQYINSTPLADQTMELVGVTYENIFNSPTVEYYVCNYESDKIGVYIKVNTLTESVAEITLYNKE